MDLVVAVGAWPWHLKFGWVLVKAVSLASERHFFDIPGSLCSVFGAGGVQAGSELVVLGFVVLAALTVLVEPLQCVSRFALHFTKIK